LRAEGAREAERETGKIQEEDMTQFTRLATGLALSLALAGTAAAADLTLAVPNGSEGDGLRAAAADYSKMKNISVDIVQAPYSNLFEKAANAGANASGVYDIVLMDDPWLPFFAENGYLEDLGSYFQAIGTDGPDADFLSKSVALCRNPYSIGKFVCLPYVGNAQMFFYNPEAFKEHGLEGAPAAWGDVYTVMENITKAGKGRLFGYVLRGQEGNPVVANFMPVFWSFGAKMFDADGKPQVNNAAGLQALEFFLKLKEISPPGAESFNADELGTYLLQGAAAASINWPNWVATFEDPDQSRVVGQMAYSPIPAGTHPGSSEIGHWLMGIMKSSKNKQAAFDFMVWATSPEQIKVSAQRGNPPVRFSVFTDPELTSQEQFRHYPVLMEAINYSTPRPRHPKWPEIENAFGVELSKAVAGMMGAKEALDRANQAIAAIIAR
jgi:multiple sugar transport system substrate-binding protein